MSTAGTRHEQLRRGLGEALAGLLGQPIADGGTQQGRRDRALAKVADAIGELIAEEVSRQLGKH
jgi:hypothetical protein